MKNILLTTLGIGLLSVALAVPASAAKGDKKEAKKAAREETKKLLTTYDKNSNGAIDGEEKDALLKAFEGTTDPALKKLDLNADGKLDDTEVAAIKGHQKGEGKGAGKKKGKKKKTA